MRKKKIKIEVNKKHIFRSYVGLVTENSVPFNLLNAPNLRAFVDPICEGLSASLGKKICLNADNCKKTLKLVAENIKKDISSEVRNRLVSLKIDSATRLSRNIFGISVQFIKNNEINSRMLGMVNLKGVGSTTSRNLSIEILKTLSKYNILLNQVVSITSDNGTNMIKATKILSHCISIDDCNEDDVASYIIEIEI
ncbi:uncharacterized protein [Eurosta solidaginis]|uniref:uncharacterized protein n=1 Tax=Eurosta solidaginis TaxID=178769 RepID=UPI00353076C9